MIVRNDIQSSRITESCEYLFPQSLGTSYALRFKLNTNKTAKMFTTRITEAEEN